MTPSGYEDAGPFQARLAIYSWQRDPVDLPGLAVARLDGVTGVVVDVGCGPGRYADRITVERPDLRRVVRPGGVVLVSSNRADNVPEAARPGRRRPGGSRRDRTVSSRCRRPRRCRPG